MKKVFVYYGLLFILFLTFVYGKDIISDDFSSKIFVDNSTKGMYVNIDVVLNESYLNKSVGHLNEDLLTKEMKDNQTFNQTSKVKLLVDTTGNCSFNNIYISYYLKPLPYAPRDEYFYVDATFFINNNQDKDIYINKTFFLNLFRGLNSELEGFSVIHYFNDSFDNSSIILPANSAYNLSVRLIFNPFISNLSCSSLTIKDFLPPDSKINLFDLPLNTIINTNCTFVINNKFFDYFDYLLLNVSNLSENSISVLLSLDDINAFYQDDMIYFEKGKKEKIVEEI